jgi:DNA-binding response OmpR family regulator
VAEDEPLIRMDIVETLADDGFNVLEASEGSEALRLIDDPDHVVLVVTDVNMPGVDGIAVALHARERHPEVPILFVSARPDLLSLPRTPRPFSPSYS